MSDNKPTKLKILYAAFEAVPFTKLGGLGDVAGTLPASIAANNADVRTIIPYLGIISKQNRVLCKLVGEYSVFSAGQIRKFELFRAKIRGITYYLIKNDYYFDRKNAYGEKDDVERFAFFSRAILESIKHINGFKPQVLHCNDWHTALTCLYLHTEFEKELSKYNIKTVYTIHNLQYQGKFVYEDVKDIININNSATKKIMMHNGKANFMKCGIKASDCVTTPSPSYAKEIMTGEYGVGLENVLKTRKNVTYGILNGIDYVDFNPAWDTNIKVHFNKDLMERRWGNKIDLQKKFKLDIDPAKCLFSVACRFYEQKGISLILKAVPKIIENDGQIIFLGDGDENCKKQIKEYKKKYKGCVGMHLKFDPFLPHNIYAGADVLLMPSKFEPCGIAQMMAMHYGTLPLVRSTGGLRDTVHDYKPKSLICNGFVFKNYNSKEFEKALDRVFKVWNTDKKNWRRMQKRGMEHDFSWRESGRKYTILYKALIDDNIENLGKIFNAEEAAAAARRATEAAEKAKRHYVDRQAMAEKVVEEASNLEFVSLEDIDIDLDNF